MKKTLGAVMFVHNGETLDYNYRETIENMKSFADHVVVLDAGSTDGTAEICKQYEDEKTKVVCLTTAEWEAQRGKEKLAYFQNVAKGYLDTDYYAVIQADEVLHEDSFPYLRAAMAIGVEAYMCHRANLWFNPWLELTVPQDRKPCSSQVIRLAKLQYDSTGDGESIDCHLVSMDFVKFIRIYHMGFVRDPEIMKKKVIYIQEKVFETPHDRRLDEDEKFNPHRYFDIERDVKPIPEELPESIQKWAEARYPGKKP